MNTEEPLTTSEQKELWIKTLVYRMLQYFNDEDLEIKEFIKVARNVTRNLLASTRKIWWKIPHCQFDSPMRLSILQRTISCCNIP